ncbi:amidohydrolase [Ahrensia sp. 13_GOM-1096m]|uniref:amidohydrolase family protein n=1 Tax=Ahrensia sp. 13_GOM-1096m TaxID=1380380 RepID=UPI00054ED73A|nr:amidohydrolase family protein [Ahrensia sp. 13_GOM-1096m]
MPQTAKIDAHQHFWQISRGDYTWMTDEVADIRHDILPKDLEPILARHAIAGTVVVQAAATIAETEFLIGLAAQNSFIKGVVGWVDLDDENAPDIMKQLSHAPILKGVRPMLQDISDTNWIKRPQVIKNLHALANQGLRLDALVVPRHLDVLADIAQQIPNLPIVIDHCAKPVIANGADAGDAWRDGMAKLALLPNVFCKISGLANEAGPHWNAAQLQPIIDHVISHFGAKRVMWGSDWPVLNLAGDYDQWRSVSDQLLSNVSQTDRDEIYGGTATRFYSLEQTS